MNAPRRLLFLTHEPWPTDRPDVDALFGLHLVDFGIISDIVTEQDAAAAESWPAGEAILCRDTPNRAVHHVRKLFHNIRTLLGCYRERYAAIQVRDLPVTAFFGLLIARWKGLRFFYWMSFPIPESAIMRAQARGSRAGIKYLFPLVQGLLGQWLLYRVVLPRADHVFVQTEAMKKNIAARGVFEARMTAVPMGVDLSTADPEYITPSTDSRLAGRRVLVYLGTLDRARQINLLFETLAIVRKQIPEILLVLVGDTEDDHYRNWLQEEASRLGVGSSLLWTGWLPIEEAWSYVRAAEIGFSPIPRGPLLDVGSPTKTLEYLALGVPVVGNDNPDQEKVIRESGGGICTSLSPENFSQATIEMLSKIDTWKLAAATARNYLQSNRGYQKLAHDLALVYQALLPVDQYSDEIGHISFPRKE